MKTVNSLSGGKTSSYMAVHYPADYEVFSLVLIDDLNCKPDAFLQKAVQDKLRREFIATAEDNKTLQAVLDLEQKIGREIKWLAGESFDELIKRKKALSNKSWRFCTTELKIRPVFEWWQKEINEVVAMRCGFRFDEKERAENFTTSFKTITGKSKTGNQNTWSDIEWRVGSFPLIDDQIHHWRVAEFWKQPENNKIIFPADSNCVGCFWKSDQQLRKNWEDNPEKMKWFANQETKKRKWKDGVSYDQISRMGIQAEFNFGTGSGCQAGFCTD